MLTSAARPVCVLGPLTETPECSQHPFAATLLLESFSESWGGGLWESCMFGDSGIQLWSSCYPRLQSPQRVTGSSARPCAPGWQRTPTQPPRVEHLSSPLKNHPHLSPCLTSTVFSPPSLPLCLHHALILLSSFPSANATCGNGCCFTAAGCQRWCRVQKKIRFNITSLNTLLSASALVTLFKMLCGRAGSHALLCTAIMWTHRALQPCAGDLKCL